MTLIAISLKCGSITFYFLYIYKLFVTPTTPPGIPQAIQAHSGQEQDRSIEALISYSDAVTSKQAKRSERGRPSAYEASRANAHPVSLTTTSRFEVALLRQHLIEKTS